MDNQINFLNYHLTKKVGYSIVGIVILTILSFFYIFFSKYNNYKPRVSKINQSYTLDIDFDKLNLYQDSFFALKDLEYKFDKELLYKIYDGAVISNGYDKIKTKIIEGKQETEEVTVVKKRVEKDNSTNILKKLQELRKRKDEENK